MTSQKRSGSYYTPATLSDFLVKHIFEKYICCSEISVLEPSVGDGQFLSSLLKNDLLDRAQQVAIHINEINPDELSKSCNLYQQYKSNNSELHPTSVDFLEYDGENKKKFSLVIGNPPYINKKYLTEDQIAKCKAICQEVIPSFGETKNIWPSFLIRSVQKLTSKGVLCFVLPSDILQVKYTKEIRKYVLDSFERVEVFAFNELIFPGIEQDVVALIGIKKAGQHHRGVSFYQVDKLEDLKIPGYVEKHSNVHRTTLDKWTNYILDDDELNFIDELRTRLNTINHYCERVEVGIVTAANNFFITDQQSIARNYLQNISLPVVQKSSSISYGLMLTQEKLQQANNAKRAVNLVRFPNRPKQKLCKSYRRYIEEGEREKLHLRYKMKKRENWFHIPSMWISEGMFVKRSHLYPKIITNEANAYVTDAFYRINMKEGYCIRNLAFSFYNTLTFILAELEGRFYGGGVLELTPNEFKNLSLPYLTKVHNSQIQHLDTLLKEKSTTETFLDYTDQLLLIEHLGLSTNEVKYLRKIHRKLVMRRLKQSIREDNIDHHFVKESILA